jgi:hypothetical protein
VIAIGLLFLLTGEEQCQLIRRIADVMRTGGRFLFSAATESGTWQDAIPRRECESLGECRYTEILVESGLKLTATYMDEGRNNYYDAERC